MGFAALLPLIELGINVLLSTLKTAGVTGTDYSTLATSLEAALAPLLGLLGGSTTATASNVILAALGTFIGVIGTLKQNPKLPADLLAKLDEYMLAAQNATTAYIAAGSKGYDPAQLSPVAPIA